MTSPHLCLWPHFSLYSSSPLHASLMLNYQETSSITELPQAGYFLCLVNLSPFLSSERLLLFTHHLFLASFPRSHQRGWVVPTCVPNTSVHLVSLVPYKLHGPHLLFFSSASLSGAWGQESCPVQYITPWLFRKRCSEQHVDIMNDGWISEQGNQISTTV